MQSISNLIGNFFLPFMVMMIVVAFLVVIRVISSRYKKIPPGKVGIFYGRKYTYKDPRTSEVATFGFKVIPGGGRIVMPFVESFQEMDTEIFQVEIDERGMPNKDNVKVSVRGVATCKISTVPEDLISAAQNFLGKTPENIREYVKNILLGHLRTIIGKMDIGKLLRERDEFNRQVMNESATELKNLGIEIKTLVIQEINDDYGYIESLGRQTVAEAKRNADITVAEAERDTEIKVSNAKKEAATVKAGNEAEIAKAEMERDVKAADYKTKADTERAKADTAHSIALAAQEETLKVAQAKRDAASAEAQIAVQKKEAERREQELVATVIRPAEAEKQAAVIEANRDKEVAILNADAQAQRLQIEAQGRKTHDELTGQGEAAKTQALLEAQAKGEAAKKLQALLAEAEGTQKLAEALKAMDERGQLIIILDKLPLLLDKGGDAAAKVMEAIFKSVAAPLGNIDSIHIVDVGGNGQGLNQLSEVVPKTVLETVTRLQAMGFDIRGILEKLGINTGGLEKILGPIMKSEPSATVEA